MRCARYHHDPSIALTEPARVQVDTFDGLTRGMTVPCQHPQLPKREPNCEVAFKVNTERVMQLFWDREPVS